MKRIRGREIAMTATNKPATPLPWSVDNGGDGEIEIWSPSEGARLIATVGDGLNVNADDEKNAAYIVAACNAYPELVAALQALAEFWKHVTPVHAGAEVAQDAIALLKRIGE